MNPYKVLGISPDSSKDELDLAYKNIVENTNESIDISDISSNEKLLEINEAYNQLTNQFKFKSIRTLIENEEFISAETELNLISDKNNSEWNYLKGFVMLKKGWIQSGITHLKTASNLSPKNDEYKETLDLLDKKIRMIKSNYARVAQNAQSSNSPDMCGSSSPQGGSASNNNDMCSGNGGSGGGIDPNLMQTILGGMSNQGQANNMPPNNLGANSSHNMTDNNGANPFQNMMGGGANSFQNMMGGGANPLQSMMGGGANPLQSMMGGGANPLQSMMGGGANPLQSMMGGGGNPLQNMLVQSMLGGSNGMNMCGSGASGGMC